MRSIENNDCKAIVVPEMPGHSFPFDLTPVTSGTLFWHAEDDYSSLNVSLLYSYFPCRCFYLKHLVAGVMCLVQVHNDLCFWTKWSLGLSVCIIMILFTLWKVMKVSKCTLHCPWSWTGVCFQSLWWLKSVQVSVALHSSINISLQPTKMTCHIEIYRISKVINDKYSCFVVRVVY